MPVPGRIVRVPVLQMVRRERGHGSHGPDAADPAIQMPDHPVSAAPDSPSEPLDPVRFLAEAGELLASSLDYGRTLEAIARLAVPRLADIVVIDLVQPDGSVRRAHGVHVDPAREWVVQELARFTRIDANNRTSPTGRAIATGEPVFIPRAPEPLPPADFTPEQLRLIERLDVRSLIAAPLVVRGEVLGALTVAIVGREQHYDATHLDLVVEIARRAALAIENALLFRAAEEARLAAERSRAALQAMVKAIDHVIIEFDAEGRYLTVTPTAAPLVYLPADQLIGRRVREIFEPELAARFEMWIQDALHGQRSVEIEYPLAIGGRQLWFAGAVSPISRDRVVWVVRDVTTRKMAEEALAESEKRFRATFEQAAVGIAHVTPFGLFMRVNRRLCDIVGYPREELLRLSFQDIIHPADRPAHLAGVKRLLEGEAESFRSEERYLRRDGRSIWATLTGSLVRKESGEPDYFIAVVEDIQDRKDLEEQLIRAQKIEAVGRLAGGVAHEFNNALTTITGFADLVLQTTSPDDPMRQDIEEIAKAAWRAAGVANRLMVFSSNQVAEPEVLDLGGVAAGAQRMLGQLLGEDVELAVELDHEPTRVHADRRQLEQVIVNLAVNARDAMPRGGRLRISTDVVDLDGEAARRLGELVPGRFVRLTVQDTGEGMSPEVQERIFDPFFTTKPPGRGTGLGLSIVYGIVRKARGAVEVDSEAGRGSTFQIYLPRAEAPQRGVVVAGAEAPGRHAGARVLLVEDDAGVRSLAERVLDRLGYRLLSAASAEEALELLGRDGGEIDLLVTDLVMPGMSGRELAETLRAFQPGLKVLFTSGYASDQVMRRGATQPTGNFIEKPFAPEELEQAVRRVLGP